MTIPKTYEQQRGEKTLDELEEELAGARGRFIRCNTNEEYEQVRRQIISELDSVIKKSPEESYINSKKSLENYSIEELKKYWDLCLYFTFVDIIGLQNYIQERKGKKSYLPEVMRKTGLLVARSHKDRKHTMSNILS